jgi:hypothetical protein
MNSMRVAGTKLDGPRHYRKLTLVAALFCATLSITNMALAQDDQPQDYQGQDNANPSGRVGRLAYLRGNVSVEPNGVNNWSQADPNYPVATGDRVYTDNSARAEVSVGSMVARMDGNTDMTMTNLSDQIVQIGLAQGSLRVRVYDVIPGNQIEVDTPNGAISLNQPGDVRITVPNDNGDPNGATEVVVNQGTVEVSGPNLSQDIGQGNAVELTGSNPVYLSAVGFPQYDDFDQWSASRDRHILDARSAQYVSRDTPGFDDLDDYGSWQPNTEYGPVWYPNNVDADYVPYQNGHWIWVDPYGWTWVDAEPWGYAPFHYGRWAYVGTRWGWVPGPVRVRPFWAPALVAFAGGGGGGFGFGVGIGYAAWFPLGVGEPYVPSYHCGPDYVRNVNVTNINITVIHNTTIINNYNTFVHNTNNYTSIRNVQVDYQNRARGFTAVSGKAFTGGQPVRMNVARVTPEMIRSATVIAHPALVPTRQSLVPRPVQRVPVSVARPVLLTRGGKEQQAAPGSRPVAVPYRPLPANQQRGVPIAGTRVTAPVAPVRPAATPTQPARPQPAPAAPARPGTANPPSAIYQARPVNQPGTVNPPRTVNQPKALINRSETPAPQPTFQQQRPALKIDPGRPLGPVQRDNVSRGVPAGRSPDVEAFPHQQPVRAAAAPRPAPQARPEPQRPAPQVKPEPRKK